MIGSLKRKFVVTTSLMLLVFTLILITAINGFTFYTTTRYVDGIIDIINQNNGGKPQFFDPENHQGGMFRPISRESLANTRYFTVKIGADGEIIQVDVSGVENVTEQEAKAYAESVLKKSKTSGYVDNYRYKIYDFGDKKKVDELPPDINGDRSDLPPDAVNNNENAFRVQSEKIITFFDWYEQKNSLVSTIILSYIIGAVGMGIVVILLIVFSRKAVDPISESIGAQREFITNVSHEIKTPLTVISGDVDILNMSGIDNEWLDNIKEQVQKSKYLVDDLVLLSKMNEENIKLSFEKYDFSAHVDESVATFYSVAQSRGLTMSSNIVPAIIVNANKQALGELVSILIENALKYCDAEGKICVKVYRQDKKVSLEISNTYVEEISQENINKMFDRYFRTRKAQSNADGSGIGLSIAKAITVAHHGGICAEQKDGMMIITASMNILDRSKTQNDEEE